MSRRTLQQDAEEFQEAMRDLAYEFTKAVGIIALVRRIPFLRLRSWVEERERKGEFVNLTLRLRNGIARTVIVFDDGLESVLTFYAPNAWAARREVSRWARSQGYESVGGWAHSGVAEWSRMFRRSERLNPPGEYLASGRP